MFTIKFYSDGRSKILSAESFTILRGNGGAEITLHQKNQADDRRIDIGPAGEPCDPNWPPMFQRAIIENAAGKTTEMIEAMPLAGTPQ